MQYDILYFLAQYNGTIDVSNKEILVPGNEFETIYTCHGKYQKDVFLIV
jgi:hypothetical protein